MYISPNLIQYPEKCLEEYKPIKAVILISLWALNWLFSIFLIMSGIIFIFSKPIPAIIIILLGIILFPITNLLIEGKYNFHLSGGMRIIVTVISFIIFSSIIDNSNILNQQKTQQYTPPKEKQLNDQTDLIKNELKKRLEKGPKIEEQIKKDGTETAQINEGKSQENIAIELESNSEDIIETHCQSEWPNDIEMKTYCKNQQYDGLTTLNLSRPSDITENQFSIIREHCKNEWPTDFKMRAYCEEQQYNGVRTLNNGKPSDIKDTEFNIIRPKCENEWIKDYKMRAYCEEQQYDAIRKLNQGKPSNISNSDFESARSICANKWPNDFKMRVYCEEQNL